MNKSERMQAEALDRYLASLQFGEQIPRPPSVPADEAALLEELVAVAGANPPAPDFIANLENRLTAAGQAQRRRPAPLRGRRPAVAGRLNKWVGFAAILAVLLVAALLVLDRANLPAGRIEVARRATVTPTATPEHTSPPPTETPAAAPQETPVLPTPSPGVTPDETPSPTATPTELPALPQLSALMGGGVGGYGGVVPPNLNFVLDTTLPEAPEQMTVYRQDEPEPLTVPYVKEVAGRLGLDGEIYMPAWMAAAPEADEATRKNYVAIDEPREIVFEGTEQFNYLDKQRTPARNGRWYPPESLPPVEQAIETATEFLQAAGLLDDPYLITPSGDTIRFFRTLGSATPWMLDGPFARVSIWTDGEVGSMTYRPLELVEAGEYAILSSHEAWERLTSGEYDGRVHYTRQAGPASWAEWRHANPRYWAREYRPGQHVDLFGALTVWFPLEPGDPLHVTMNGLVLMGDLQPLAQAQQALRESVGNVEAPMHVWGEVQDASEYLALRVEGWEVASQEWWDGTIRREGDRGLLVTGDGRTVEMPELPHDLASGTAVYIEGGLWRDRLEWVIIQEHPADEGREPPGGPQVTEIEARVEKADLIYFLPPLDSLPPELASEPEYRLVQPLWRFSGHTEENTAFEIYVQAVRDTQSGVSSE